MAATKKLVAHVNTHAAAENFDYTVALVAQMWASEEAAEGIASFLQKREPAWRKPQTALA